MRSLLQLAKRRGRRPAPEPNPPAVEQPIGGPAEDSSAGMDGRPILFLDVDGVLSLFGFSPSEREAPGRFHFVDGIAHCIPADAGARLKRLAQRFELVWATGWEHRANQHLLPILDLPDELPCLTFGGLAVFGSSHWKLDAVDLYAGDRPAAWIDDNHDDACRRWARARGAPTLLVGTDPPTGLTDVHVQELLGWADAVAELGEGQAPGRFQVA